jgi:hypothetical protein
VSIIGGSVDTGSGERYILKERAYDEEEIAAASDYSG